MFSAAAIEGMLLATLLFAPVLLLPGYAVGYAGDLFGFRACRPGLQLTFSVLLSTAVSPLIVYLGLRAGSPVFCFAAFVPLWLVAIVVFVRGRPRFADFSPPRYLAIAAGVWLIFVALSVPDLHFGARLYHSAIVGDHGFRVALIDSIGRNGVPVVSPVYHLNGPERIQYHVFWFALCSFASGLGLGHIGSRDALNASVVWAGLALILLVPVWFRQFEGLSGETLRRRSALGVGLLLVTGLDLIPVTTESLRLKIPPPPDTDWWAQNGVNSWLDVTLWVPHHVAALVSVSVGFLLIWHTVRAGLTGWRRVAHAGAAALAFANTAGCSMFVAIVMAGALGVWLIWLLARRSFVPALLLASAGLGATLPATPYLAGLLRAPRGADNSVHFGLWDSSVLAFYTQTIQDRLRIPDWILPYGAHQIICLPLEMFLEFGLLFVIAVLKLRSRRQVGWSIQEMTVAVIAGSAAMISLFVKAGDGQPDRGLGMRGMLIVQFLLLTWAAGMFDEVLQAQSGSVRPTWWKYACILTLMGLAGTVFQVFWLRLNEPVLDERSAGWPLGNRIASREAVYRRLDVLLRHDAVIQTRPTRSLDNDAGLYSHRQVAAAGIDCGVNFGGDEGLCRDAIAEFNRIFDGSIADPAIVAAITRRRGIDVLVVDDSDGVWRVPDSWIHRLKPIAEAPAARAYIFPPESNSRSGVNRRRSGVLDPERQSGQERPGKSTFGTIDLVARAGLALD